MDSERNNAAPKQEPKRTYRHKSGKKTIMKTGKIGKSKSAKRAGGKVPYSDPHSKTVGVDGGYNVTVDWLSGAAPTDSALADACQAAAEIFRRGQEDAA
jgi:hypothetical protein